MLEPLLVTGLTHRGWKSPPRLKRDSEMNRKEKKQKQAIWKWEFLNISHKPACEMQQSELQMQRNPGKKALIHYLQM